MKKYLGGLLLAGIVLSLTFGAIAFAAIRYQPCHTCCPREGIECLDVYQPVICSNGVVYPNACAAYIDCATGCEDLGGGGDEM